MLILRAHLDVDPTGIRYQGCVRSWTIPWATIDGFTKLLHEDMHSGFHYESLVVTHRPPGKVRAARLVLRLIQARPPKQAGHPTELDALVDELNAWLQATRTTPPNPIDG